MKKVIYQIYPRSFCDTNADGVGDINGITRHLDYIRALGADTIWLCPVFCSPMVDNGYDISDYRTVDPTFGTNADLTRLIDRAKEMDIGVLLDLVLNHTSNKHPWFESAVQSEDSPYRDFYIFRKGIDGRAPNNWRCNFGGSAWEKADGDWYYLHTFAKEQPDLNWENPAMRSALYEMIQYWLSQGVQGFRIDAISFIKKNQQFPSLTPDGPDGLANPADNWLLHSGIEAFLAELRDKAFKPYGAYTVAEANGIQPERLHSFIGENGYFSAAFDFSYTDIDLANDNWHSMRTIDKAALRHAIFESQLATCRAGHGAVYLENHDQNRSPNKYLTPQEISRESITMLGALYFFLQGTAFLYQGQELGLLNYPWKDLGQFNDIATVGQYHRAVAAGYSPSEAFAFAAHRSRDNARVPMPWTGEETTGFTQGNPWLPVYQNAADFCAQTQQQDESSILSFYRRMAQLRQGEYARLFYEGGFVPLALEEKALFAYERSLDETHVQVYCNFQNATLALRLPKGRALLSNIGKSGMIEGLQQLAPFEALVLLCCESGEKHGI